MSRRLGPVVAAVALVLLALSPTAGAGHAQSLPAGGTVSFQHKAGGNEWWVEVVLRSTSPVSKVEAMDDGGPWVTMTHRPEWGSWSASFRIEPGHKVTFRATTAAGTVTSCPFTHPGGVEQCGASDSGWVNDAYSGFSGTGFDLATADTDGDGRGELYAAGQLALFELEKDGVRAVSTLENWFAVASGDLDGDGRAELYASRSTGADRSDVHQFQRTSSGWSSRVVFSAYYIDRLAVGDVDRDGRPDVYAVGADVIGRAAAWQLRHTATGAFAATRILIEDSDASGRFGEHLWIGDADRDGQVELAVMTVDRAGGQLFLVDYTTTWQVVDLGRYEDQAGPVVAGDIDGDGRGEVAVVGFRTLHVFTKTAAGWQREAVLQFEQPSRDLFLGDADNDGRQELYVAAGNDALLVRKESTGWTATRIGSGAGDFADRLIVGDGDRDGVREAFLMSFDVDTRVTWVTRIQKEGGSFGAGFSGVRGNAWWVQAHVDGRGGQVVAVDARADGGAWRPLAQQSWGAGWWAASYHLPEGTVVQLRATSSTGAVALSDCYRWVPPSGQDAAKVPCPGQPQPGAFDATYRNVQGNEWWVEAVISANHPVRGVFVHIGGCGGEPADMTYRADWGKWTLGGTRIPPGTKVVLEAYGESGSDRSGGYIWPDATSTSGC